MHTNNDNVVSDNLPIYFIWFGSDVPNVKEVPYFDNLKNAAKYNKSRDIILVYSEKHLLQNNRKNIDSIESMSIDKIKKRVKLKKDSRTKNLFKIDVYDMELDKQDRRIYDLLDKAFAANFFDSVKGEVKSFKYCIASDLIRLPLLNITGGIYLDMDTEIIGKVERIESKNSFGIHCYDNDGLELTGNFLIKVNKKDDYFCRLIKQYFDEIENSLIDGFNNEISTDPAIYLNSNILGYYMREYLPRVVPTIMQGKKCKFDFHCDRRSKIIEYTLITNDNDSQTFSFSFKGKDEICLSYIEEKSIFNYGINVPQTVKLKMEMGEGYNIDYNNQEDLKKLDLDKQDCDLSSKLENPSLEQLINSQEKGR